MIDAIAGALFLEHNHWIQSTPEKMSPIRGFLSVGNRFYNHIGPIIMSPLLRGFPSFDNQFYNHVSPIIMSPLRGFPSFGNQFYNHVSPIIMSPLRGFPSFGNRFYNHVSPSGFLHCLYNIRRYFINMCVLRLQSQTP